MEINEIASCGRSPFLVLTTLVFSCGTAHATGLAIPGQSVSGAAVAVAGMAAGGEDASTVFYNPAGMTRLQAGEATATLGITRSGLRAADTQGIDVLGNSMRTSADSRASINAIPSLFAVFVARPDLRLGIGISTPFGQSLAYDSRWLGRYAVQTAALQDNAASLSGAFHVSDMVAVGGGVDYHHASVERVSAVDFGTACFGILSVAPCSALGLLPQRADGQGHLKLSGHGIGYNVGVTGDFGNGWRTGLAYRSAVRLDLDGDLRFDVPATALPLNATGAFNPTRAHASLTLPESVSLGVVRELKKGTSLLFGAAWTRWSRFSTLAVGFDNPQQPASDTVLHWRNAWRYSAGVTHALRPTLLLHAGVAHQQSPVDAAYASPVFPIGAANELDLGCTWKAGAGTDLVFSYGYQRQQSLAYSSASPASGSLRGDVRLSIQAVALQLTRKF